jgi:hypothetical protein
MSRPKYVDSGICLYYRSGHCTMAYACPWGKSQFRKDGVKECKVNGVIGDGHKLGGKR